MGTVYTFSCHFKPYFFIEYRAAIKKYLKFGAWHVMATMDAGSVTNAVYQSLESFWPGALVRHNLQSRTCPNLDQFIINLLFFICRQ